jgi:hypothetical protein
MALDDPKLPRTTLRGEKLYAEGEEDAYFRDPEHTIRLRVATSRFTEAMSQRIIKQTSTEVLVESLRRNCQD